MTPADERSAEIDRRICYDYNYNSAEETDRRAAKSYASFSSFPDGVAIVKMICYPDTIMKK